MAEILFDGTRSKGIGIVQFTQVEEASTAIGMWLALSFCQDFHHLFHSQPSSKIMYTAEDLLVRFISLI